MGTAREHAKAEPAPRSAAPAREPVTELEPRELDGDRPPTLRERMAAAFGGGATTRSRITGRARAAVAPAPPVAAVVQTKLTVSRPGDPLEREADAVAVRVLRGAPAPPRAHRAPADAPIRGPPGATRDLPHTVASIVTAPGGGRPLDAALRERIEPHVGIDLSHVRVRQGPDAAAAARDLHARAFTSGSTIFLGAGSSTADVALMAHEATHVAQQQTVAAARSTLMRDVTDVLPDISLDDVIPDWILDGVRETVRAIPGYILLTYIAGRDPLSDEPAPASPEEVVEALLTRGPFGAAVGAVLQSIDVLGEVFGFVMEGLEANDLTLARLQRDIDSAWEELSVTNGIAGNAAIVERYVTALVNDVTSFVESIAERVLEVVRSVVATVAEPLLDSPLWSLAKKVMRTDPLRGVPVEAPTAEIVADFLRLIGEEQRLAQMEERGTLQTTADWLDTQLATFAGLATDAATLFSDAWAAIQPDNLPNLLTDLEALAGRAIELVVRVGEFAATVIAAILELIKDALLAWLSETAASVPGFPLLTVIIGQDPFTGEAVPRTAENLIKGFITLIPGGASMYDELAESGVIGAAAARIDGEMERLGISLEMVTGLFLGIWDTLTLDDLLDPLGAFSRILALFGDALARLIEFIAVVIEVVVTLILRLMNFPTELLGSVISNTVAAITDIKRDPVGFLKNMVEAIKLGFTGFFDNFARHLLDGLVAWLFRGLGQLGITLPADFSLGSILTLIFQVLGLTVEHLWEKLGEHIGAERVAMIRDAINRLTGAWAFIQEVQRDGLAAIWRYVKDQLGGIWTTLLSMATEWIIKTVVVSATVKLLSFIDPSGIMATINTCIAIFNAVMSAIEYMRDMLEVFNAYVSTLAAVAAGNIVPGAQMLEGGLAAIVPIAIGFLAKQVGIGNIPDKIAEIIGSLRELIDEALDWLISGALRVGRAALDALGLGETAGAPEAATEPITDDPKAAAQTLLRARLAGDNTHDEIAVIVAQVKTELAPAGLSALELRGPAEDGSYEVHAAASEFTELVRLVRRQVGRTPDVRMNIRMLMHSETPSLTAERSVLTTTEAARDASGAIEFDDEGNPVMVPTQHGLPPTIAHGRQRRSRVVSGGIALPVVPATADEPARLRLMTFNTSEDPSATSNLTHAERQLQEFLERAPTIARDVAEIHADINWSPCSMCSSALSTVTRITPRATYRVVRWHTLYEHPIRGTTDTSLGAIVGWSVIPSTISGNVTPAQQAELAAADWAELTNPRRTP